jgi:hypothetical protein
MNAGENGPTDKCTKQEKCDVFGVYLLCNIKNA